MQRLWSEPADCARQQLAAQALRAFSRCETGKTRPPLALVKLLKVLDRHPELINEVRAFQLKKLIKLACSPMDTGVSSY